MTNAEGHLFFLEQRMTDLPDHNDWLGPAEKATLSDFRVAKRLLDWRLGRWTAKCAVSAYLGWSKERMRDIQISSLPSGAPKVDAPEKTEAPQISISHSSNSCLCVVGVPRYRIGCDIEKVETRSQSFIETFFTPAEVLALTPLSSDDKKILVNIMWSTKESYLKSTREGLTRDTTEVETSLPAPFEWKTPLADHTAWLPIWISNRNRSSVGYWRLIAGFVETVCQFGAPIASIADLSPTRLLHFPIDQLTAWRPTPTT